MYIYETFFIQLQMRNSSTEDAVSGSVDFNPRNNGDGNYLEPAPFRQGNRFSIHNGPTRHHSVGSSSNGPLSPLSPSPPPPPPPPHPLSNNNYANQEIIQSKEKHRTLSHTYSNNVPPAIDVPTPHPPPLVLYTYANVDITPTSPISDSEVQNIDDISSRNDTSEENLRSPVYMNVVPGQEIPSCEAPPRPPLKPDLDTEEGRHCYANLEPGEIEGLTRKPDRVPLTLQLHPLSTGPLTPPQNVNRQVNYIVLDLDQTSSSSSLAGPQPASPVTLTSTLSLAPESPNKPSEGYATIDFDRTVALQTVSATAACVSDEGSRKTRHNSTISELTTPIAEEGTRKTRHNSTISDLVAPLTSRLSTSLSD